MVKKGRIGSGDAGAREARVASVMIANLPELMDKSRVLVVEDLDGHVFDHVRAAGARVERWSRVCSGDVPGAVWPPEGPFDLVLMRLPRAKEVLEYTLHAIAASLGPKGQVFVYGSNDEGIKSADKRVKALFRGVKTVATKSHCRVISARFDPKAAPKRSVEEFRAEVPSPIGEEKGWVYFPGVFARGKLDVGTKMLCEALPGYGAGERVLDFAAGAGVISGYIQAREPGVELTMLEADAVALEAARLNVPGARVVLSDAWSAIAPSDRFDHIVSNPPIHRGKSEDYTALHALIERAPSSLVPGGTLTLVIQRQISIEPLFDAYQSVEVVAQDTRFRVWRAQTRG